VETVDPNPGVLQILKIYVSNCAFEDAANTAGDNTKNNDKTENLPTNAQRPTLDLKAPEFISPPEQIAYE